MTDINIPLETFKLLLSSGIATLAAFALNNRSNRQQEEKRFKDDLHKILQISIQYPILEDERFTEAYPGVENNRTDYLRYESYCILIFNLLEQVSKFYNFQPEYVENFLQGIDEWVNNHKKWWQDPEGNFKNQYGYDKQFIELINSYIKAEKNVS